MKHSDSDPATQEEGSELGQLRVGLAAGGTLRWASAELAGPLKAACAGLDLSPLAAAALGRCLTGAALLCRMAVKTPVRFVLELSGDGPLRKVLAEVEPGGNLRGMVGRQRVDLAPLPNGDLDVGQAIGSGLLRVWRQLERSSYQSQVTLESGGVGQALAHYLEQSEQVRSAVLLGVLARPEGVAAAGGILVEVLPGADAEVERLMGQNMTHIPGTSHVLATQGLDGLEEAVLAGLEPTVEEAGSLRYFCRCRREKIGRYLAGIPASDLEELRTDEGDIETECVFCGARYRFEALELEAEPVN